LCWTRLRLRIKCALIISGSRRSFSKSFRQAISVTTLLERLAQREGCALIEIGALVVH
jgi:hypothetical protein